MASPEKPPQRTFWEDFEHIKFVGFLVCIFISLPSLGIPAILAALIDPGIDSDGIEKFWEVLLKTVPLTVSAAILGTAYLRGWTKSFNFAGHCFFLICVLLGTGIFFKLIGFDSVPSDFFDGGCIRPRIPLVSRCKSVFDKSLPCFLEEMRKRALEAEQVCNLNHPGYCDWYHSVRCKRQFYWKVEALRVPLSSILSYWNFYGLWNFICSLVVGSFISWAWAKKLMPHLIR